MSNIQKTILIVIVFAFGVFVGQNYQIGPLSNKEKIPVLNLLPGSERANLSLFWKVWDTVSTKYRDKSKVDRDKMVDGAIAGMVAALGDPYTVYLSPEQNKGFKETLGGKYSGVGIRLGYENKRLVVIAPLDDSPAFRAGVKAKDIFLKIGEKDAENMTVAEAANEIKGTAGTKVKLMLLHQNQEKPYEVELLREEIVAKTLSLLNAGNKTAYVKLTQFGDNTISEWDNIVSSVTNGGYQKMILDLRNNPGGRFDTALYIGNEFLPNGVVIARQETYNGERKESFSKTGGRLTRMPLVVLINEGSASASEILAGSLIDNKRAKVVGEQSFGKGTVQEVVDYDNGAGLHITTSRWLTPNGTWVDETKGVKPDIEIKESDENVSGFTLEDLSKDPVVKRALEIF